MLVSSSESIFRAKLAKVTKSVGEHYLQYVYTNAFPPKGKKLLVHMYLPADPRDFVQQEDACASCHRPWIKETEEVGKWIACSYCNRWYHMVCTNLAKTPPKKRKWKCGICKRK